jgi:hypothetical protein
VPLRCKATLCRSRPVSALLVALCHAFGYQQVMLKWSVGRSDINHTQCVGAKSSVDDLTLGRGVVTSWAATILRATETHPFMTGRFVSINWHSSFFVILLLTDWTDRQTEQTDRQTGTTDRQAQQTDQAGSITDCADFTDVSTRQKWKKTAED